MNPRNDPELNELLETPEMREAAHVLAELGESEPPNGDFNRMLRRRWQAEITPARSLRLPRWFIPVAIAAALLVGFLGPWGIGLRGGGGAVAWAQVVQAMNKVQHFHMTAFIDDPRAADESKRQLRIDLFYQQPDKWRGHGLGNVQFISGADVKTWNIEQNRFLADNERRVDLAPSNLAGNFKQNGLLSGILSSLFKGQVPAGEPVKSDEVAESAGIAVFDFAHAATRCWARIWVLRDSQLPLRMHVHFPESDQFALVTFDYSDPQPAGFFDPDAFEQGARAMRSRTPNVIYNVGSAPVSGLKPRGASQINQVQGGYRAPTLSRITANDLGDVMIITDNPQNRSPNGSRPAVDEYRRVKDNWGNLYLMIPRSGGVVEDADRRHYFVPIPPFKKQEGQRILTLEYWVQDSVYVSQELAKPFHVESIEVPPARAAGEEWDPAFEVRKQSKIHQHYEMQGTLAEQLVELDRMLTLDPNSMQANSWKVRLYRKYGREEAAWEVFESKLRDQLIGPSILENGEPTLLSQYLLRLIATGRLEEHRQITAKIREVIDSAVNSTDPRIKMQAQSLLRQDHNWLLIAMDVPAWMQSFKDGPRVVRTANTEDGLIVMELEIPEPPKMWMSNGSSGDIPRGWFWEFGSQGKWPLYRVADPKNRRLLVAYEKQQGGIKLQGVANLALDNYGSAMRRNDVNLQWNLTIAPPTERVGKAMEYLTQQARGRRVETFTTPAPKNASQPAIEWIQEASTLQSEGKLQEAVAMFERVLKAADDQWPDDARSPQNDPMTMVTYRRLARTSLVECLARLGRYDEAHEAAEPLREGLPAPIDPADFKQWQLVSDWVTARLHIARALVAASQWDQARLELATIASLRVPLSQVPDDYINIRRGAGTSTWNARFQYRELWRSYDAVWWDVKEKG